jgi:hypothetical protein
MGMGKSAHGKFSLTVATTMASMPPLKDHRDTISCRQIGATLGTEAKQGTGHKVACFWGIGANGGEFCFLKHSKACHFKCR